ncbi:MAG: hypothetical protein FWE33_01700 [Defluviitaleaceae bacterium]|nr:hypothetical protein [Defluviitaleaceae bacterium]
MSYTRDDFMSIEVFEGLNEEFRRLGIDELDLSADERLIPTAEFINGIERRIGSDKVWQGENRDMSWLDYNDVNRWFGVLKMMSRTI